MRPSSCSLVAWLEGYTLDTIADKVVNVYPSDCLIVVITGSKTPIRLSNSVGVIDSSYRGQLMAIVDNVSDEAFTLKKGERYFQVCAPDLGPISFEFVDSLSESTRGVGGLGSTGR